MKPMLLGQFNGCAWDVEFDILKKVGEMHIIHIRISLLSDYGLH